MFLTFHESRKNKARPRSKREMSELWNKIVSSQISSNDRLAQVEPSNARWVQRKSESSENTHKAERLNIAILSFRLSDRGPISQRLSYLRFWKSRYLSSLQSYSLIIRQTRKYCGYSLPLLHCRESSRNLYICGKKYQTYISCSLSSKYFPTSASLSCLLNTF